MNVGRKRRITGVQTVHDCACISPCGSGVTLTERSRATLAPRYVLSRGEPDLLRQPLRLRRLLALYTAST